MRQRYCANKKGHMNLTDVRRNLAARMTTPLVGVMSRAGITPNALTLLNLALNVVAACVIARGQFLPGGILVLVSGLFDLLDGAVARFTGRSTKFGAVLDSTVDRITEAAVLFGLLVWYTREPTHGHRPEILLLFAVLIGSFLVSYVKARAEGVDWQCGVGLFTRAERVIVLAIGLIVNRVFIALCVLGVFAFITVLQRLAHLQKQARTGGD
jgi:CDP-diacylglycerol---glycerol-3-phosphate 3-phosphatidyltransferase